MILADIVKAERRVRLGAYRQNLDFGGYTICSAEPCTLDDGLTIQAGLLLLFPRVR